MPLRTLIVMILALLISPTACTRDVHAELIEAAQNGQTEKISALLAAGAEVNAKDKEGMTALIYAAYEGHFQSVKALLNAGADVNA